jgi:uncharacterized protein
MDDILTSTQIAFQWDPNKARSNQWKHEIIFESAATIFADPNLLFTVDPKHSNGEEREWAIGESDQGQVIVVSFIMRQDDICIISARPATKQEIKQYVSGI